MSDEEIELVPDIHPNNKERIAELLEEQAEREERLIAMVKDMQRMINNISNSMPITEEERLKNRMIRMNFTAGIAAPFFPHIKRMQNRKPQNK